MPPKRKRPETTTIASSSKASAKRSKNTAQEEQEADDKGKDHMAPKPAHDSSTNGINTNNDEEDEDEEEGSDEDIDWEDAMPVDAPTAPVPSSQLPMLRDLELTIEQNEPESVFKSNKKRGPSAIERRMRMRTHMAHVEYFLKYGAEVNRWLNEKELQDILVEHLSAGLLKDVEKYKKALEKLDGSEQPTSTQKAKGKDKAKSENDETETTERSAARDPLVRLVGILMNFWRKRFKTTAPGLRKVGYPPAKLSVIEDRPLISLFEIPGKAETYEDFLELARKCQGSRDTGEQLFTGLLRGLGIDTRMVFSLQPLGFSFSSAENADVEDSDDATTNNGGKPEKSEPKLETPKKRPTSGRPKNTPKITPKRKPGAVKGRKARKASLGSTESEAEDVGSEVAEEEQDFTPDSTSAVDSVDSDLIYPVFWTEIFSPTTLRYYPVDPITSKQLVTNSSEISKYFEPKGKVASQAKQVICYIVAYSDDESARDVTVRYLSKNIFPGKSKGFRLMPTRQPIYDVHGDVIAELDIDWFEEVMNRFRRKEYTDRDQREDEELQPKEKEQNDEEFPDSIQGYKNHPKFVLERHLYREEALLPSAKPIHHLQTGPKSTPVSLPVYPRSSVVACKTIENWYREGRVIKENEPPLKSVKPRAATIQRKREIEANRQDNIDVSQGLWAEFQTEIYKPPPCVDGRVPRNGFGNCDVYRESMVPEGAVHLPLKGSMKVAKKLGVDAVDAVVGFEFTKQRAVPIIQGIVIPAEMEDVIRDAWRAEQTEKKRREDTKREAESLNRWRSFLMRLRIVQRLNNEYSIDSLAVEKNPFVSNQKKKAQKQKENADGADHEGGGFLKEKEEGAGGFVRDGEDGEGEGGGGGGGGGFIPDDKHEDDRPMKDTGGGFLADSEDEGHYNGGGGGGGFLPDSEDEGPHERRPRFGAGFTRSMVDTDPHEEPAGGGFLLDDEDKSPPAQPRSGGGFIVDDNEPAHTPQEKIEDGFLPEADDDQHNSHSPTDSPPDQKEDPTTNPTPTTTLETPRTLISPGSSPLSSPPSTLSDGEDEYEEHSKFFPTAKETPKEGNEAPVPKREYGFSVVIGGGKRKRGGGE